MAPRRQDDATALMEESLSIHPRSIAGSLCDLGEVTIAHARAALGFTRAKGQPIDWPFFVAVRRAK
jgi:hypothetical protein